MANLHYNMKTMMAAYQENGSLKNKPVSLFYN